MCVVFGYNSLGPVCLSMDSLASSCQTLPLHPGRISEEETKNWVKFALSATGRALMDPPGESSNHERMHIV